MPDAPAPPACLVYLHGFASSPGARKADFFRERLAPAGLLVLAPDLNRPSFASLTLSAQVEAAEACVGSLDRPPVLVGSSMGALVALLLLARRPAAASRVLLIAPAFSFVGDRLARLAGSSLDAWRARGFLELLHYGDERIHRLGYQLVDDAARHDFAALRPRIPTLVVQGSADELIPLEGTRAWVAERPGTELCVIAGGDHGLGEHLDELWAATEAFVLRGAISPRTP